MERHSTGAGLLFYFFPYLVLGISAIAIAWFLSNQTPQGYGTLTGKWFQSYELARRDDPGGEEWVPGKTGRVVALLEAGLYLVAYDNELGETTINQRRFYRWRFFETEADLAEYSKGLAQRGDELAI
jgi:hypothetical protein